MSCSLVALAQRDPPVGHDHVGRPGVGLHGRRVGAGPVGAVVVPGRRRAVADPAPLGGGRRVELGRDLRRGGPEAVGVGAGRPLVLVHPAGPDAQVRLQAVAEHHHLLAGPVGQLQLPTGHGPHRDAGHPLVDAADPGPVVAGLGPGPDGVRGRRPGRRPQQQQGQPGDQPGPATSPAPAHRRRPRAGGAGRERSRSRSTRAAATITTAIPVPSSRIRLRGSLPDPPADGATPTTT